jgi:hypothetical protein
MTKKEKKKILIKKLKECQKNTDTEAAHHIADLCLIVFINDKEINKEYQKIKKWYA